MAVRGLMLALSCALVAGCASAPKTMRHPPRTKEYFPEEKYGKASPRVISYGDSVPKGGGRYQVGKPYKIAGKWYKPKEDPNYEATGVASWYGSAFHGRQTANGEIYDMHSLTAAHPTLPLPSYVRVTNLANKRSVVVRVNDRGPYAHGRVIDLSQRAAEMLDYKRVGTAKVKVTYVGKARMDGLDHEYLMASLTENGRTISPGGPSDPGRDTQPIMVADASPPPGLERTPLPPAPPVVTAVTAIGSTGPAAVELAPETAIDAAGAAGAATPQPPIRPMAPSGTPVNIMPAALSASMPSASPIGVGSSQGPVGLLGKLPAVSSYRAPDRISMAHSVIDASFGAEGRGLPSAALRAAHDRQSVEIHAGVFADPANAERARKALADIGSVKVVDFERDGRTLTLVRISGLAAGLDPEVALERARTAGYSDAYILR
ncbi:MAG: septal ring lytic transglycosylase RlpA family protein [Hyphomicrobiales bacterium]